MLVRSVLSGHNPLQSPCRSQQHLRPWEFRTESSRFPSTHLPSRCHPTPTPGHLALPGTHMRLWAPGWAEGGIPPHSRWAPCFPHHLPVSLRACVSAPCGGRLGRDGAVSLYPLGYGGEPWTRVRVPEGPRGRVSLDSRGFWETRTSLRLPAPCFLVIDGWALCGGELRFHSAAPRVVDKAAI